MATTITINATDVTAAANFLEEFLTDEVPVGDFTAGTALRDLTVQALAAVVAFLRADAAQIRQMQSLVTVQAASGGDPQALSDAVTGILSNFFVTAGAGALARGYAIGHASTLTDVFIPASISFTLTAGLVFVVDNGGLTLFIPQAQLVPIIDTTGAVVDYEFRIPLVSVAPGTQYNIQPGQFSAFDRFNPYVTSVECTSAFEGGNGPESTTALIARAPTAISVRCLINDRSIPATLDDNFDGIDAVLVIGMGDPEMVRDIVPTIAPHLLVHVGGCVDVYLRTALVETTFTGAVGGLFVRPDGIANAFRDGLTSFASVLPGDIIVISAGLPVVPLQFLVTENEGTTLLVSESAPFPIATDQAIPPTTVSYTIGRVPPLYSDVVSGVGGVPLTTGTTSGSVGQSGRITMPGLPVMNILDVAVLNPPVAESAFVSTLDGFEHFPNQVNRAPSQLQTPAQGLQFQAIVHDPPRAQSAQQWMEIVVGTDLNPSRFDGLNLRIVYQTLDQFGAIDAFVRGPSERIASAYLLPRAHNPVVVSMTLTYKLSATATTLLDNAAVAQTIANYVNAFDASTASIDVSTVIQVVKDAYPTIANIVPPLAGQPILTIFYNLLAPTGDVFSYATTDIVTVDPSKQVAGPTSYTLASLGVTDRVLRYVAAASNIIVKLQGT
jgi:hypothetical protein